MFNIQELFRDGHISETAFLSLSCGMLDEEESQLLLSHLDKCEECRARFILELESDLLPEDMIPQMEQSVLYLIEDEKNRIAEKKNRFRFIQITKLAVAVCLTMVMFTGLALATNNGDVQLQRQREDITLINNRKPNDITEKNGHITYPGEQLLSFTQGLYNSFYDFTHSFRLSK